MHTFSLDPRALRVLCLVRRNPLVRRSDRLEVLVITLAVAISLLAVPFVASIATDVYQVHRDVYAELVRTRHRASTPTPASTNVAHASVYRARGMGLVAPNATPQSSPDELWVDDAGIEVAPPTPPSHAAYEAVGVAALSEGLAVTIAAAFVVATRWQIGRIRYSHWDRELSSVLGSHSGGRSR
jgi:hypothetical protein